MDFRWRLKVDRASIERTCARDFQVEGADTEKAREQKLLVIATGLVRRLSDAWHWHCSHVCASVCSSHLLTAVAACGGFAARRPAGRRFGRRTSLRRAAAVGQAGRRYRSTAAAAGHQAARHIAARRSAANASSVTLSAVVGSWTEICYVMRALRLIRR